MCNILMCGEAVLGLFIGNFCELRDLTYKQTVQEGATGKIHPTFPYQSGKFCSFPPWGFVGNNDYLPWAEA